MSGGYSEISATLINKEGLIERRSISHKDRNHIVYDPFPIGIVDNFVSQEQFADALLYWLSISKQDENWTDQYDSLGAKMTPYKVFGSVRDRVSAGRVREILAMNSSWKSILQKFESQEFANELTMKLRKNWRWLKPIKIRDESFKENCLSKIFYNNVYVSYKISRYPPGSSISLHRDLHDKVVAFLFYLGFNDGKNRLEGGTQFYRRIRNSHLNKYEVDHFVSNRDDFEEFLDVHPIPNRLAFFIRTDNSWHGVRPFGNDFDAVRDNVQINYVKCRAAADLKFALRIFKSIKSVTSYITQLIYSIFFVFFEAICIEMDSGSVSSKKSKVLSYLLPKKVHNLLKSMYLFFKGGNVSLDQRRRLIRKTINRYCCLPRFGLQSAANYLIDVNKLFNSRNALCFGIYNDIRFETVLASKYRLDVLASDPTPIARNTISSLNSEDKKNIEYLEMALSKKTGKEKFYFDSDEKTLDTFEGSLQNIGNSKSFIEVNCGNLQYFREKARIGENQPYILKMDIEGGAIEILEQLISDQPSALNLPVQIMLELELPLKDYDYVNFRISGILASMKKFYDIFYIPRMKRYTNYDFLFVIKDEFRARWSPS